MPAASAATSAARVKRRGDRRRDKQSEEKPIARVIVVHVEVTRQGRREATPRAEVVGNSAVFPCAKVSFSVWICFSTSPDAGIAVFHPLEMHPRLALARYFVCS